MPAVLCKVKALVRQGGEDDLVRGIKKIFTYGIYLPGGVFHGGFVQRIKLLRGIAVCDINSVVVRKAEKLVLCQSLHRAEFVPQGKLVEGGGFKILGEAAAFKGGKSEFRKSGKLSAFAFGVLGAGLEHGEGGESEHEHGEDNHGYFV